jgi:hypothetical protein
MISGRHDYHQCLVPQLFRQSIGKGIIELMAVYYLLEFLSSYYAGVDLAPYVVPNDLFLVSKKKLNKISA